MKSYRPPLFMALALASWIACDDLADPGPGSEPNDPRMPPKPSGTNELSKAPTPPTPSTVRRAPVGSVRLADLEKRNEAGEIVGLLEDGRWFKKGAVSPFSGYLAHEYSDGQVETIRHFRDGLLHGLETSFYAHGGKRLEMEYDAGKVISQRTWNLDGVPQF